MVLSFFGTKLDSSQAFDDQGGRLVVSNVQASPLTVTAIKTTQKDGYEAIQLAIGKKSSKSVKKPQEIKLKAAKLKNPPRFFREIKLSQETELKVGDQLAVDQVLKVGDMVKVTGTSKGAGFAGVMKRHGFAGGPRSHGQSDRERAPGSIGMRTDPGRVWKGKKMAGRMGGETVTVRNLIVLAINNDKQIITVSGTIPGKRNGLIKLTKTGASKKQINLFNSKPSIKPKLNEELSKSK
jgi:large subunit ribosomal protein L3